MKSKKEYEEKLHERLSLTDSSIIDEESPPNFVTGINDLREYYLLFIIS